MIISNVSAGNQSILCLSELALLRMNDMTVVIMTLLDAVLVRVVFMQPWHRMYVAVNQ